LRPQIVLHVSEGFLRLKNNAFGCEKQPWVDIPRIASTNMKNPDLGESNAGGM
jgi:hypothetical protein